ncbi:coth protein-domain-containing protein [Phycomyces nitens]|nr:coth protein-domain-containing protein [Phycomyces nitens]
MRISLLVAEAVLIAAVLVAGKPKDRITYSVIYLAGGQQDISVVVDNVAYPLSQSSQVPVLYTGSAPIASYGYKYSASTGRNSAKTEDFTRNKTEEDTPNETFGRRWNTRTISKVNSILPPISSMDRIESLLHIDGEIPTIYFSGNQSAFDNMHNNPMEEIAVVANVSYISPHDVKVFLNVELELGGLSSRIFQKLSYNIKLKKSAENHLYGYRRLKLRAINNDFSYIRESLGYDIIKAVGVASTEFSYVRVIMNDRPLGLFGLIENYKDPWIKNEFANGDKEYEQGILYQSVYQMDNGNPNITLSDLSYFDNTTKYEGGAYKIKAEPTKGTADFQPLIEFTKFINDAPTDADDAAEIWNKKLDTESFLRCVALEVLLGFSDGYIGTGNNYYLYYDPKAQRYVYLPSDIDLIFGSGFLSTVSMTTGNYLDFPGFHLRPLTNKIVQVHEFKARLEELIFEIIRKLYSLQELEKHIDDVADMIEEDVAWDYSLPRVSKGVPSNTGSGEPESDQDPFAFIPPTVDIPTAIDLFTNTEIIPFRVAVEGPTGHLASPGIKEFIKWQSDNTLNFWQNTTSYRS